MWDPEYEKNYLYRRVKSYTHGILLLHITSNTPLDIQDFWSVMDMNLYSRMKEIFLIENNLSIRFVFVQICM